MNMKMKRSVARRRAPSDDDDDDDFDDAPNRFASLDEVDLELKQDGGDGDGEGGGGGGGDGNGGGGGSGEGDGGGGGSGDGDGGGDGDEGDNSPSRKEAGGREAGGVVDFTAMPAVLDAAFGELDADNNPHPNLTLIPTLALTLP